MADVPGSKLDAAQDAIVIPATTYYLGFNTGTPGDTGANEGTAGRMAIKWGTSATGTQANTISGTLATAPGAETYTHFSVWTASSGGTYVRGGSLTPSITPGAGSTITVAVGALKFTAS